MIFGADSRTDVEKNIAKLTDNNEETRRDAAEILLNLSRKPPNKDTIRESRGIAPLVKLLKDGNHLTRQWAAGALRELACENCTNQDFIREAQGIGLLIALLKDDNALVRQYAAGALLNLASNNHVNQSIIHKAQGIESLVALLQDANLNTKKNAIGALWNLAGNLTNKDAIRESQGIIPLIELLLHADAIIRQYAVGALFELASHNPTNQAVIIDYGALPKLNELANTDEKARKTLDICQILQKKRQLQGTIFPISTLKESKEFMSPIVELSKTNLGIQLDSEEKFINTDQINDTIHEIQPNVPSVKLLKDNDPKLELLQCKSNF